METKQAGKCPFCEKNVRAVVVEENKIRRDKCKCPECDEIVFICRTPSCHDYAKGTSVYDHELCPSCSDAAASAGKSVASGAGKVVVAAATVAVSAVVAAAVNGKK